MESTVFYSWQSDDNKTRMFIEKSLRTAIDDLKESPDLFLPPRFDKDTQGEVGAVHVAQTIMNKIDKCSVFVADISLTDTGEKTGRRLVNQNVLIELGYALGKHSESKILLVSNTDLGDPKQLPFDIEYLRRAPFSISTDKKGERLTKSLKSALDLHLKVVQSTHSKEESKDKKIQLVTKIEESKPTKSASIEYFEDLYTRINNIYPGRYQRTEAFLEYGKKSYDSFAETFSLIIEFNELIQLACEYKNEEVILQAFKRLELLTRYYDIVPEDGGHLDHTSCDFYYLVCNELVSLLLGNVAEEGMWSTFVKLDKTKLLRPAGFSDAFNISNLHQYPSKIVAYFDSLTELNYHDTIFSILDERYKNNPKEYKLYIGGSLLWFLAYGDYPWAATKLLTDGWNRFTPEYISNFRNSEPVTALMDIKGYQYVEELRENIWSSANKQINPRFSKINFSHVFKSESINSPEDIYYTGPSPDN